MSRASNLDTIAPDDPISDNTSAAPKLVTPKIDPPKVDLPKEDIWPKIYDIVGHTKSPLSSSLIRPKVFSFEEKNENEEIVIALRPHWINNAGWFLLALLFAFLPFISVLIMEVLSQVLVNYNLVDLRNLTADFNLFFHPFYLLFWYLLTFIYAFERFVSWYFNVFIITTERVIDIDFYNLFNKKFSSAELSMIQDVTYSIIGFKESFFNYGDVLIQTASEINEIVFERVSNPDRIIKVLEELRHNNKETSG
ncbi:MAG: PH domain-containing protein [Candidatus Shapirobacteria bacterium]|nr:PH domain-containing protein [Candidatus Shapirobacteria bacterium]